MRRLISLILGICLMMPSGNGLYMASAQETNDHLTKIKETYTEKGQYGYYLSKEAYADIAGENIELISQNASSGTANGLSCLDWQFDSSSEGRFLLKMQYSWNVNESDAIERSLSINGVVPYKELEYFTLPREYAEVGQMQKDKYGNDIRPDQKSIERVTTNYVFDYANTYTAPLSVNVKKGQNVLRLVAISGNINLKSVILVPTGNIKSYAQVKADYKNKQYKESDNDLEFVEGENAAYKSTTTIYPISDRSSPLTSPYEAGKILLNTIGGYHWDSVGEYIAWNVHVKESGLYKISIRLRQNTSVGQSSSRILYINGEIPFQEAMEITTPFSNKWQIATLGNGKEDYSFYLHEGENEIRLQASLGKMDAVIREVDSCIGKLNEIYRKLLIIMGSTPDLLRDYRLNILVPEQISDLKVQAERLSLCADWIEQYSGKGNTGAALMKTVVRQLLKMNANPDGIPQEFSYFKTNIGSISTWVSEAKSQPLEVDLFAFGNKMGTLPKANADFLKQSQFTISEYFHSFFTDYQSVGEREGDVSEENEPITVWIARGREQAQIVRNMIAKSFTPKTGISVRLQLVTTSLLPATVAGIGPDAVIQSSPDVVNFAMRNAAHSLSDYEDADEILKRFEPSVLIRLRYLNKIYGLPETISFPVLFYRSDILDEMGIEIPKTWDDTIGISSVLAKNNMEFGMQINDEGFLLLLKQHGLGVYAEEGKYCLLNSVDSINVFKFYTNLYTNYGFPLTYNFLNRFRTGEMPIGISSFNFYNEIQVAAPEINGLWGMTMVPGVENKDGTLNRTALSETTACMILESSDQPDEAWEFLKWWTSADVQTNFSTEIESVLGESGRYNSANLDAFAKSAWSDENMEVLQSQMKSLTAIENVPGGYFLSRNLTNAFRAVVYKGKLPTDVLYDYTTKIDSELTNKRKEFGLSVR